MRRPQRPRRFRDLPIISITANADAETKSRMSAAGANATLAKPIDQVALFATLARWISPRAAAVPAPTPVEGSGPVREPEKEPVMTSARVPEKEPENEPAREVAPPPPSLAPSLPALPGVDVEAGLTAVGGKLPLYTKLLAKFGGQLDDLDGELLLAIVAADWAAAARAAHAIKGAARTLGANEIGDRAAAVEAAARDASPDPLDAIEALRAAANQLRPALAP